MKSKPDFSCFTGSESGKIAYIWNCYQSKRVVIYQSQAGMMTFPAKKRTFKCSRVSRLEKKLKLFPAPKGRCLRQPRPYTIKN